VNDPAPGTGTGTGPTSRGGAWKLACLLAALIAGPLAAEMLLRMTPPETYDKPMLRDLEGRSLGTLSDIVVRLASDAKMPTSGFATRTPANMHILGCYDRPSGPGFDDDGCIAYRTNALGFRDDPFPLRKPADELRVLTLGDSFTFGLGVPVEDCWVQQLEGLMQAERRGPVQVINGGFAGGYLPPHYATWMEQHGMQLQPDLVLLGFCLNDMGPVPMAFLPPPAPTDSVLTLPHLRRALMGPDQKPVVDFAAFLRKYPKTWLNSLRGLTRIQTVLAEDHVRFVVVLFPMLIRLTDGYPFAELHEAVVSACAEADIECLDLLDEFVGLDERALWAHPTDQHPNRTGHRLISDAIHDYLTQNP
jgi:lysophospholipase L1-like esterase